MERGMQYVSLLSVKRTCAISVLEGAELMAMQRGKGVICRVRGVPSLMIRRVLSSLVW